MRVAIISQHEIKKLRGQEETDFFKDTNSFRGNKNQKKHYKHFWHKLTGVSAKCDFVDQTDSLIMDGTYARNPRTSRSVCRITLSTSCSANSTNK